MYIKLIFELGLQPIQGRCPYLYTSTLFIVTVVVNACADGICRRVGEVEVIFSLYANLKLLVLANGEKMGL